MTDQPLFDPFAALAAAKTKALSQPAGTTLAELSQPASKLKDEQNHDVAENFATFATLAGGVSRARGSSSGFDIRKKERFSLSFQVLTTNQGRPWLTQEARQDVERAATPARVAILREYEPSHCKSGELSKTPAARVLREREAQVEISPDPASSAARVDQAAFDERAGFLEYDCGLSREAAERQARQELQADAADQDQQIVDPLPSRDGLALWLAGLDRLSGGTPPCPGYRGAEWPATLVRARSFLDHFGEQAEALGWTAPRLFGAHPTAGIVRVDTCGALVLTIGGPVRAITATEIRFSHLTHREKPGQTEGVPIWALGR